MKGMKKITVSINNVKRNINNVRKNGIEVIDSTCSSMKFVLSVRR